MSMEEIKPLSDAEHFEEFTNLRNAARAASAETAEPKSTQPEEGKTEIVADPVAAETTVQEVPAEASVEDQIKALRKAQRHKAANELMVKAATQAANERAEKAERELEAVKRQPAVEQKLPAKPVTEAKTAIGDDPEPQPTEDKYAGADGYLKYQRDLTRWDVRQENRAIEQKKQDASIGEKITQKWNAAKGKYPDFEAATHPNTGLIPTNPMKQFIIEHDLGMDVLYQLGKDLPEFSRISQLTPVMQMAELGYMARLIATPPPAQASTPEKQLKPAVSKASTPPRVLGGANASEPKPLSEAQTFEDFQRRRTALKAS